MLFSNIAFKIIVRKNTLFSRAVIPRKQVRIQQAICGEEGRVEFGGL